MAEEHVCIMLNEFKHIADDMTDRKNNERDMQKNISDIRTSQERTMYVTEQVQKAQELQAVAARENHEEVARTNKEYKTIMDTGFRAIEDKRITDEKATLLEKKETDKEKVRLKELQAGKDEAVRLEKKDDKKVKTAQTWGMYLIAATLLGNILIGVLTEHAQTLMHLLMGE